MNAPEFSTKSVALLAETHDVVNVARELADFNPYLTDVALQEAVAREGAADSHQSLAAFGATIRDCRVPRIGRCRQPVRSGARHA